MNELDALREHFQRQGLDHAEAISAACSYLGLVIAEHSATEQERELKARRVASWIDDLSQQAHKQMKGTLQ